MKILAFFSKESTPRTYDFGVYETANNTVGKMLYDLEKSSSKYFRVDFRNLNTAVRIIKNFKNAAVDLKKIITINMVVTNVNGVIEVWVDMDKPRNA